MTRIILGPDLPHDPPRQRQVDLFPNQWYMSVVVVLLLVSLMVAALFLGAFIWSVQHHQFDDDYAPPIRILFDDEPESGK